MVDLEKETPVPLIQACNHRLVRNLGRDGRPVSYSAIYRWVTTGISGVRLEHIQVAGKTCTTEQALIRFIERLSNPPVPPSKGRTEKQKQKAVAHSKKVLAAFGI